MNRKVLSHFAISSAKCGQGALAACPASSSPRTGEPPVRSHWRLLNATLSLPRLLCGATLLAVAPCLSAAEIVRVQPPDTGAALVNPGMGWTLHFYSNFIENYGSKLEPSDTLNDWPRLLTIYLRVPWSYLEPKEGEFNWSLPDLAAQPSKP